MKISIPTRDGMVDDHFGHCDHYTIYNIENNIVTDKATLPSPQGCGCKSNIAFTLHEMGVTVMLAGNMGQGAKDKLNGCGISVIRGCKGNTDDIINAYIAGTVSDSGIGCAEHDDSHQCHEANKE
ncbi:MAG: NifB/NifX family molybdenum-iron cluster-binding protein [Prevotella sp.]|nr:NifB/NifX family molybdenum-iron cluster-binding protein [Prevotella sp.]HRN15487.1 NifB/NifX family molybdenum-iron cluster-binding protein [Xylanibacter oryzae]